MHINTTADCCYPLLKNAAPRLLTTEEIVVALRTAFTMFKNSLKERAPLALRKLANMDPVRAQHNVRQALYRDFRFSRHNLPGQPLRWGVDPKWIGRLA